MTKDERHLGSNLGREIDQLQHSIRRRVVATGVVASYRFARVDDNRHPGGLAHLKKRGHRLAVSEIKPLPVWEEFSDPGKPTRRQSLNFPNRRKARSRVC